MKTSQNSKQITFQPGDFLFKEGDPANSFYIIEEGIVDVFISVKNQATAYKVTTLSKSETLGELAIINQAPRNASAQAVTQVTATEITAEDYTKLLGELPQWSISFIQGLAKRIQTTNNRLSQEYAAQLAAAVENMRMGKELLIAKTVQDTLFPGTPYHSEGIEIFGHYSSASECSGDWWHFHETNEALTLWIGDATGHGVSAALITSAARAVAAVLESSELLQPSEALCTLNRAIYQTSKGQIMMTFFMASLHKRTKILTYANASHEPIFLIRKDPNQGKTELIALDKIRDPRLGEVHTQTFSQAEVQLEAGDFLFAYTDGLTGLINPRGRTWGELGLIKSLRKIVGENPKSAQELSEKIVAEYQSFKKDAKLPDDVTLFSLHFDPDGLDPAGASASAPPASPV